MPTRKCSKKFFSLETIQNSLKCRKIIAGSDLEWFKTLRKAKKIFKNFFLLKKISIFLAKCPFLAQNDHFQKTAMSKKKFRKFFCFVYKRFKNFYPKKIVIFGQNSVFLAKNGHFATKMDIFWVDEKKNFWPNFSCHLERHFKLSYAPLPQCIWSG